MRLFVFALEVFAAIIWIEKPAEAQSYPWCVYYDRDGGATNCGFSTFQQCLAARAGNSDSCGPNPQYQGLSGPASSRRVRHHFN